MSKPETTELYSCGDCSGRPGDPCRCSPTGYCDPQLLRPKSVNEPEQSHPETTDLCGPECTFNVLCRSGDCPKRRPQAIDWNRECVVCGHKWWHDGRVDCPVCAPETTPKERIAAPYGPLVADPQTTDRYVEGWQDANHAWQRWLDEHNPDWDKAPGFDARSLPEQPK